MAASQLFSPIPGKSILLSIFKLTKALNNVFHDVMQAANHIITTDEQFLFHLGFVHGMVIGRLTSCTAARFIIPTFRKSICR
jgi:hypothetical protein